MHLNDNEIYITNERMQFCLPFTERWLCSFPRFHIRTFSSFIYKKENFYVPQFSSFKVVSQSIIKRGLGDGKLCRCIYRWNLFGRSCGYSYGLPVRGSKKINDV